MRHHSPSHSFTSTQRRAGWTAAVLMLLGPLTACQDSSSDEPSAKPTASASAPEKSEVDPAMVGLTCKPDDKGVWFARMKLVNTSDEHVAFLARVAVIKTADSDVVGRQTLRVEMDAGDKLTVPFDELAYGGRDGLSCDPRVVKVD